MFQWSLLNVSYFELIRDITVFGLIILLIIPEMVGIINSKKRRLVNRITMFPTACLMLIFIVMIIQTTLA